MASNRTYKCPFCDKRFIREDLVNHITDNHESELPEGFSPFRYVFHYVNKKPLTYHGICTECKGPTDWDEERGRYKRQCNKKSCYESYIKKFESNMQRVKGVKRISQTDEGQLKMLANRKISGTYRFSDGGEKTYTGSYERQALEFMDKVLNVDSKDVITPGPILQYQFNGTTKAYITDIYYQPYNLIIEVKDGGNNPNKRNMPEYRAKQIAKEKFVINHTDYNYLRLTDNKMDQLLIAFALLRNKMEENSEDRVIQVNENSLVNEFMSMMYYAPVRGFRDNDQCAYIVNYMQNNVFHNTDYDNYGEEDEQDESFAISRYYNFCEYYIMNKDGILEKKTSFDIDNITRRNKVVKVNNISEEMFRILDNKIGDKVDNNFLYETVFGKKFYNTDQIYTESNIEVLPEYSKHLDILGSCIKNRLLKELNIELDESFSIYNNSDKLVTSENGKYTTELFGLDEEFIKNYLDRFE